MYAQFGRTACLRDLTNANSFPLNIGFKHLTPGSKCLGTRGWEASNLYQVQCTKHINPQPQLPGTKYLASGAMCLSQNSKPWDSILT